jgi:hypothetical protein
MKAIPVAILLLAATVLGVVLGLRHLRRMRRPPVMIGAHLLLGAGGLELFAMLLRGTPSGTIFSAGTFGWVAAALLAVSMFAGVSAALFRRSPRAAQLVLLTHAALGAVGVLLFFVWVATL